MPQAIYVGIFLLLLPLLYAGRGLPLLRLRAVWVAAAILALAALGLHFLDRDALLGRVYRVNLILAVLTITVLALRHYGVSLLRAPRTYRGILIALAALSVLSFVNFFQFHGRGTSIHYHDLAHYYLGSRYFKELGYSDLYTAMLRAEAETYDNQFVTTEARDLYTNKLVHARLLLERSEPVKRAFTPGRWADFQKDVSLFRDTMGAGYGTLLKDHGYNPTPFWTLIGGTIANRIPAGSKAGIQFLALLDIPLVLAIFAALTWAFGLEVALLCLIFYSICFGATYGWIGGAYLRHLWLFGLVGGIASLHKQKYPLAGALLAGSVLVRFFPAFFVAGSLVAILAGFFRKKKRSKETREHIRFVGWFAAAAVVFLLLTSLVPGGMSNWESFERNTAKYRQTIASNRVGLTNLLAYQGPEKQVTAEEFQALQDKRSQIYRVQLATVFLVSLVLFTLAARKRQILEAAVMGMVLIFTAFNMAGYYYVFLLLLIVINRGRPDRVALVFAAEACQYALWLVEDSEGTLYIYRSMLVLYLLLAMYGRTLGRELLAIRRLAHAG